eukprot:gene16928-23198_t
MGSLRLGSSSGRCLGVTMRPMQTRCKLAWPGVSSIVARAEAGQGEEVPDVTYSLVGQQSSAFRALPLVAGAAGVVGLLANRIFSGVAPVVDRSSSQPHVDVDLEGTKVYYTDKAVTVPAEAAAEMKWAWEAMQSCTRCKSLVIIYKDRTLLHAGYVRAGREPGNCKAGRPEFTEFLPENIQGVVVQPIGKLGVLIAATDTVRGFSGLDQLDAALETLALIPGGTGFGAASKSKSS